MKRTRNPLSTALVPALIPALLPVLVPTLASLPARAQEVKVSALVDVWYTQALSSELRTNAPAKYSGLNAAFQENTFTVRRAEITVAGKLSDEFSYTILADPSIGTAVAPNILHDAFITYKPVPWLSLQAGQFKPLQTYEATLVSVRDLLFYDRSQLARAIGDKRDRGLVAGYGFGRLEALSGKFSVGFFNGTGDKDGGKSVDANAQKDVVARLEFSAGRTHKFGVYGRSGSTDARDAGALHANAFSYAGEAGPSSEAILAHKDRTTNLGGYYAFENETWIAQAELATGLLGRRYPSVGIAPTGTSATPTASPAGREHLDQRFLGYVLTGGVKVGRHTFVLRHDVLNYNHGNRFYGPYNPYTRNTATGAPLEADFSPRFSESVAGWNYAFVPGKWTLANFKVDYIHRSRNVLKPSASQTGERGGDSLVAALQLAF